jgi:acyl dehydratase
MSSTVKAAELPGLVGRESEPSSWMEITQDRVNQFADATNDHQFIHINPEKAAATPFGGPVAHGFLVLSLLPYLTAEQSESVEGLLMAVNYGSDRVRFIGGGRETPRPVADQEGSVDRDRRPAEARADCVNFSDVIY